jgi:uncharacterized protein YyaL (SSP411 family)
MSRFLAVLFLLFLALPAWSDPPAGKPRFTNRLAKETSPYLLMHAHNPVDWYPWGPEAFEKARKEGKLIFLSVGYSSCYWCHVMARQCFENEEVAKLLNKWFVCIKVDREERPDIDHIYMTALETFQQINRLPGGGGWPLTMFLTADGRPIFGGTYWPPDDHEEDGRKVWGLKSILKNAHKLFSQHPKEVDHDADVLAAATRRVLQGHLRGIALVELDHKLAKGAIEELRERFDKVEGGFGLPARGFKGPKFPTVTNLELLLQQFARTKSPDLLQMVTLTLDKMARGGIYDQLGGGFHRYATERTWTVPHFEKMLYDNAQLVEIYAKAYRLTKNPLYRRIVRETLAYVQREMLSPEGAFSSSQDAETNHEEGRFYVWTDRELDAALLNKAENRLARRVFGADGAPNFEEKYYVLTRRRPLADLARDLKVPETELRSRVAALKAKLLAARDKRPHPFVNRTAVTAWSGLMIAGFAEAGQALQEPTYVKTAARAADFVLKHQLTKDGRLLRTWAAGPGQPATARGAAYLDDYAFLVHGLLALHAATDQKKWLDQARTLTDVMLRYHGDKKAGGYYFTANDHEKLFARSKDQYDGATPSGNSMAALNLVQLWQRTGEKRYRAEAERTFRAFAGAMQASPLSLTTMARALETYLDSAESSKR